MCPSGQIRFALPVAQEKPPLRKGGGAALCAATEGCRYRLWCEILRVNPSVSLTAASALSTREPRGARLFRTPSTALEGEGYQFENQSAGIRRMPADLVYALTCS